MYSPAGHPSVRCSRSWMLASSTSAPAPLSRRAASSGPIARSSAPISTIPPWARRRAAGSGTSAREASANRQPGGRCRTSSAIAFRHCLFVTASAWSSSTVTGRSIEAMADTNRGTTVMPAPEEASAQKMVRVDRLDPVQRNRERAQQHDGVVVPVVAGDPGHARADPFGPLRHERGLAVAGRGDHGDDRCLGGGQPVDQGRPGDDPGTGRRGVKFRLGQLEAGPQRGPAIIAGDLGRLIDDLRLHPPECTPLDKTASTRHS